MLLLNTIRQISRFVGIETCHNCHIFKSRIRANPCSLPRSMASQRYDSKVCWKCGLERKNQSDIFCRECSAIQEPQETENYFRILDLDEKFDIDTKELRSKYRTLLTYLHPDKFTNKTEEEQLISENFSSLVNKAYNSLQVPLKRAEHLLKLKGDTLGEEQTIEDPEFLMEMMELNEELESTKDVQKLKEINLKNKNKLDEIAGHIDECFRNNNLKEAKSFVIKMKYYSSLGNRINAILRELGVVD